MKIKIDRREYVVEYYTGAFGETELENERKANNIKAEDLTLERCAEVINTNDVDATVKNEDGEEINIYELVTNAVRNMAFDWGLYDSGVEDVNEEIYVDWED